MMPCGAETCLACEVEFQEAFDMLMAGLPAFAKALKEVGMKLQEAAMTISRITYALKEAA